MAQLSLVRIDTHLIHTQIRRVWLKLYPSKLIVIIDNEIAHDPIVSQVYILGAPPGMKVRVMTTEEAAASWQKDRFGPAGPVFVLMRDIETAVDVYQKGFDFPDLLVGWLGGTAGGGLYGDIKLTENDKNLLKELEALGCKVSFPAITAEYGV